MDILKILTGYLPNALQMPGDRGYNTAPHTLDNTGWYLLVSQLCFSAPVLPACKGTLGEGL